MLRNLIILVLGLAICFTVALPIRTQTQPQTPAASAQPKNDYSKPENWLCRPDIKDRNKDACATDMSTTIVAANGKLTTETWAANPKAPIDCFYVYPTVSNDQTPN